MAKRTSFRRLLIIPAAVASFFMLFSLTPASRILELKMYDLFLHMKPAVRESKQIVLLDIDEESIVRTAAWPWPRGLVARGLETLAEMNASYAVFDIEYLEKSPMSVDRDYLRNGLKSEFDSTFDEVGSNISSLFGALSSGSIRLRDAGEYGNELVTLINDQKSSLYEKVDGVAVENDSYLGQGMRLFGHAFVTLNLQKEKVALTRDELRTMAQTRFSYPNATGLDRVPTEEKDFLIPIPEVSSMAAGAGFTNVMIDTDGVRRRIRLVEVIDGRAYLQLVARPMLDLLGNPKVEIQSRKVVLKDAMLNGKLTTITIPLDEEGCMLIRWPKELYFDSFRHISFYRLLEYRHNEDILVQNLRSLRANEVWTLVPGSNPVDPVIVAWEASERARQKALKSGTPEDRAAWLSAKAAFKDGLASLIAGNWGPRIQELLADAGKGASAPDAKLYAEFSTRLGELWGNCTDATALVEREGRALREGLNGAICVIGWTAAATTDIGANPFDKEYINVGTHAAVANAILQNDFLRETPQWLGAILALALAAGIVLLTARIKTTRIQLIVGIGSTALVFAFCYLVFHLWGLYLPALTLTLTSLITFLAYTLATFVVSEREKSFLRKAFGTYLSGDVINQIMTDPSKYLKLGGQKKWISAMFTDVRGFSTISEALDAEQLVKVLNIYLSAMSDIVLEHRGTIDKFEGDAIISFFGAPLSFDEHARATCLSAIRMKQKEVEINQRLLAEGLTPSPLLTRIGINTGDMVVGNMGTERKMDYTIMGNAVNLAARLEGVNKQYGSWILASDATKIEAGEEFVYRRFDKVRVVGINTPVQLWEVVGLKDETDESTFDFLERFEKAHAAFDERDWKRSEKLFAALAAERPEDGPSATYLKKSQRFIAEAPAENWDGVFSLSEK